jgi:ankyrin repeat protein
MGKAFNCGNYNKINRPLIEKRIENMNLKRLFVYSALSSLIFFNPIWTLSEIQRELAEEKAGLKKELADAKTDRDTDLNKCLPIHDAALANNIPQLQKLLDQHANLDSIGCFWQMTPIQYIIFKNETTTNPSLSSTVQWFLEHGARDLEHKDYGFGRTALHLAAMYNQPDVINILCKYGANTKAEDNDGMTSLHLAAQYNNVNAAIALINNGVPLTIPKHNPLVSNPENDQLSLAIHIAAYVGSIDILNLFINTYKEDVNIKDNTGNTPLHYAAISLKPITVKWLLDHGADRTIRDNAKKTALNQVAGMLKGLYDKYKANQTAKESRTAFENFVHDTVVGSKKKLDKQILEGLDIEYPEELVMTSEEDVRNNPVVQLLLPPKKE